MIPMEFKNPKTPQAETQIYSDHQTSSNSTISDDQSEKSNLTKDLKLHQISSKLQNIRKKRNYAIKKHQILSPQELAEAQIRKKQSYLKRRPKF